MPSHISHLPIGAPCAVLTTQFTMVAGRGGDCLPPCRVAGQHIGHGLAVHPGAPHLWRPWLGDHYGPPPAWQVTDSITGAGLAGGATRGEAAAEAWRRLLAAATPAERETPDQQAIIAAVLRRVRAAWPAIVETADALA